VFIHLLGDDYVVE